MEYRSHIALAGYMYIITKHRSRETKKSHLSEHKTLLTLIDKFKARVIICIISVILLGILRGVSYRRK